MAGLHLFNHARGISDEQVCAQWIIVTAWPSVLSLPR